MKMIIGLFLLIISIFAQEVRTNKMERYKLPELPYGYKDLEPYISEEQLTIHHQKHHLAYVNGANSLLERLEKARQEGVDIDMKATLKELSFNIGGHLLHSIFWTNLAPAGKGGGGEPKGALAEAISQEFGSFARFKKEFTQAGMTVEGSGWVALTYDPMTKRLLIMQIEKHNVNIYPTFPVLLIVDVFEHAYYIDYKNNRAQFLENIWNIINWQEVEKRFNEARK